MKKILKFMGKRSNWALPYIIFMAIFVVAPLLLVAYYSFLDNEGAISLYNFEKFCTSVDTINTFIYSIGIAMMTTLICILIGYPAAYFMANSEFGTPKVMAMLFILPMWINILLRTLSTVALFDFMKLPLDEGALIFGMVYNFLPFMIYPIYNTMQKMDKSLIEAAQDLGANRYRVFRDVIMPLSVPGVYSGIVMVFMPTISTFAVSELLTMNKIKLFGTTIQENINAGMLNYGAALSLIMLIIIGLTSFFGSDDDESNETGGLL
ncbi:MAG: ABC transporter permease [Bacteroidaceae bacterium]|jgi:spermidine/putrescine transport system permease protein|nr:ABC transporter permease [Bacteroidaceae bacterium]